LEEKIKTISEMSEEKSTENIKSDKEKTNVEEFVTKYNITETIENALNDAFSQNSNPFEFLVCSFLFIIVKLFFKKIKLKK
jgi:hypothetical protein